MSERIIVGVFGVAIEIDASALGAETRDSVVAAWSSARATELPEPDRIVQARDLGDLRETLAKLAADVALATQDGDIGDLWLLRARAFIGAEGRTVVVCGAPASRDFALSPISELFSGAVEGIFGIDTAGGVTPIPMPPSFAIAGGVLAPSAVLRLAKVVFLDCADDAPEIPEVDQLELGEALSQLVVLSEHLCGSRAPLRGIAALLSGTGGAVRIRHRAASPLEPLFAEFMESEPADITLSARSSASPPPRSEAIGDARVYRGEVVDSCLLPDGRIALLKSEASGNGGLRILDALESAIWQVATGVEPDFIVDSVGRERGSLSGGEAAQRIAGVVAELSAEGLLRGEPAWAVDEATAWVSSDARTTVLNLAAPNQPPLALEGSAHVVWNVVSRSRSISQSAIIDETAAYFGVEGGEVAEGVINLLHDLASSGALSHV